MWNTRRLTLAGKIILFFLKSMGLSKIMYISTIANILQQYVEELDTIQNDFINQVTQKVLLFDQA